MATLPAWLLEWAETQRFGGEPPHESTWLKLLDELVEFQHYRLDSPFRSQTMQELLALVYQPYVRSGYSVNTRHGGLRPPITLTNIGRRISRKQFLPALVDILDEEHNETFEGFVEPLRTFLNLEKEGAMSMLQQNQEAENAKLTPLPKGMLRTRRVLLSADGDDVDDPRVWRISPGQFGTSGQSRRAFVLDMLAARAAEGGNIFEGLDYLTEDQRTEILERIRAFQDETQYAKQDERGIHHARAISDTAKRSNRTKVMDALNPLFAKQVRNKQTFESVVLGLLQATDPDLARWGGERLASAFAEACATSAADVEGCMKKLRKGLCEQQPLFLERLANLGFPLNPC
jgi:hypothetical protein